MKLYEIWKGYYHLGQGHDGTKEPHKVDVIKAADFKTACMKYELMSTMRRLMEGEALENLNDQDYEWFYDPKTNSNSWTGPYFETEEEALETFKGK